MISSWNDLRHLEAYERLGSARAAGRELGVAASTIYRRIAELEKTVGITCLVRGKGITAAARELITVARETDASLRGIAQRARDERVLPKGTVRLTTLDGFTPLLAEPLAELANTCPRLRVEVSVSDTGLSLRKGHAEVGLALVSTPPSTLVGRKLFPVRFGVYANTALAPRPDDARWVVLGSPLERSWLGKWEAEHVPKNRIAASTASRRLLLEMVSAGVGIGLVPDRLAAGRTDLVRLAQWNGRVAELTRQSWLLFPPALRDDARVKALMAVLTRHLARTP